MTRWILPVLAAALVPAGCRFSTVPEAKKQAEPEPPKITEFYTTTPNLARGESALVCYSVENAKTVWLSPPRKQVNAAVSHCEEVSPKATTTYTLTAEGPSGPAATLNLTVNVGPPHVKIVEVQFTTLNLKRGEVLGICYVAQNAAKVEISPIGYHGGSGKQCTTDRPVRTTTYIVTATGPGGDRDKEQATVEVH